MWPFGKKTEVIGREKFSPIHLLPGDSIVLTYSDKNTGKILLAQAPITATTAMTVDEGVLIATTFEGRRALGGLVLEK